MGSCSNVSKSTGAGGGNASTTNTPKYTTADKTIEQYDIKDLQTLVTAYQTAVNMSDFDEDTVKGAVGKGNTDTLFRVSAKGNGEIEFKESYGEKIGGSRKYPVYKHEEVGAYYLTKTEGESEQRGINWDNVKSVSGKTFRAKEDLKSRGFSWDRNSQKWVKK